MKTKIFCAIAAMFCLFAFSSCKKDNVLNGTIWGGTVNWTDVEVSFVSNSKCQIILRGYADGSGVGSYVVSDNNVDVTITSITGSFDKMAKVGDVFNCTFDLSTNQLKMPLRGKTYTLNRRFQ